MGLTTAPTNLYLLAWIALIPLWVALYNSFLTAILSGFSWGLGYHGFALFWITGIHPMTWMGVPWFNSLIIALFCWLFITCWGAFLVTFWAGIFKIFISYKLSQFFGKFQTIINIILGVTIWCLLEKIWSFSPLWWTSLSFTQSPYNLAILQLLRISGTTTITLLIVLVNGLFAENMIFIARHKSYLSQKNTLLISGLIILITTHIFGYINYQKKIIDLPENKIKIGIIQGNIPNEIKLYDRGLNTALLNYTKGYNYLAKQGVDVILTPETALPFFYEQLAENSPIFTAIKKEKIPLFLGAFDRINDWEYTNTLFMINKEGELVDQYDKIQLVPLGEYIPFYSVLGGIIRRLSPLDTQLIAGGKEQILNTPFGKAIVGICYDSAFSENFRRQAMKGGQYIITASNNAHYHDTMPEQHHAQDVMRAIELDRWMARATNTGYSAIVDPHGNTHWLSELNQYETYKGEIYRRNTTTFYGEKGDWLIILCLVLFFLSAMVKISF